MSDPQSAEHAVTAKVMRRLLPFLLLMYVLAFLNVALSFSRRPFSRHFACRALPDEDRRRWDRHPSAREWRLAAVGGTRAQVAAPIRTRRDHPEP